MKKQNKGTYFEIKKKTEYLLTKILGPFFLERAYLELNDRIRIRFFALLFLEVTIFQLNKTRFPFN